MPHAYPPHPHAPHLVLGRMVDEQVDLLPGGPCGNARLGASCLRGTVGLLGRSESLGALGIELGDVGLGTLAGGLLAGLFLLVLFGEELLMVRGRLK